MRDTIFTLLISVIICVLFFTQATAYDYTNMTPEEIEQLKGERHAFYKTKSEHKELSIKRQLVQEGIRLDGNQADYDVRYYGIHISLDFVTETIDAHIDYKIRSVIDNLNSVDLNLHNQLIVDQVFVDGVETGFSHLANILAITTPTSYDQDDEFDMTVYYHGKPAFIGWGGMDFDVKFGYLMCWTNCEPYESRNWWPCKDFPSDKADSLDLYIEYPAEYRVASVGRIISIDNLGNGRELVHYKHNYPIVTYLVALSCADFQRTTDSWYYKGHTVPVYGYSLEGVGGCHSAFLTWAKPSLTHLSDAWGLYPFADEKMANASYGGGGAMEHQTCNMYSPVFCNDWVIAHETAHQWWGDMITCETFHHIWLNEGFASYSEAIFMEREYNQYAYFNWMQSQKYLGPGTIYIENLETDPIFDGDLSYDKASWVLHMLRGVLGDDLFFQAIGDYYDSEFKFGTATTEDLADVVSNSVGYDMSWYFNQWIYGEGHPDYQISWLCEPDGELHYRLGIFIEQTQTGGTYFTMPIKTTIYTTGGSFETSLWNDDTTQTYMFGLTNPVTSIVIDPKEWILRTVEEVPFTMHIFTMNLAWGVMDLDYSETIDFMGGVQPYTWSVIAGGLPDGLILDQSGVISGIPTDTGTFNFTVQLADFDSPPNVDSRAFSITILEYVCGDADGNGIVEISDAVYLIEYIFNSGPAPEPVESGDVDCNDIVEISDVVYLIAYIFTGGPIPCADCL